MRIRHLDIPRRPHLLAALLSLAAAGTAGAQEESRSRALFERIRWADGPVKGYLGQVATVAVPASCRFTADEGAKLFMEATENPPAGNELGVLLCQSARVDASPWFVVFSFDESGYVKDDEKDKLDADAILSTLEDGNDAGNRERKERGWETIDLLGWERKPFYDPETHNLTWSTRLTSEGATEETINHSVRLLGRRGVMHADLVISKADLATAVPSFDRMIANYGFAPGHRYAEWRSGDKVAEYGLTALIAGGAGAAAAKLGFFGKLWKFVLAIVLALKKLVIVVILAAAAFVKKLFGRKDQHDDSPPGPSSAPVRAPYGAYPGGRPTPAATATQESV